MKRLLLTLAVVAVAVTSCQKDVDVQNETDISNTSSNVITIQEACDNLNKILRCIDPQTRGAVRTIGEITPLPCDSYLNSTTRTASMKSSELLYLVNFEDNNGYAVLAANTQISPSVLFITDSGSAEISDFETIRTIDDANGLSLDDLYYALEDDYYLGAVDTNNNDLLLQQTIINNVVNFRNDVSIDQWDDDTDSTPGVIRNCDVDPLVITNWYQGHPFNSKFTVRDANDGDIVPAGCTTIATGQLLTCIADRDLKSNFDIEGLTWGDIRSFHVEEGDTIGSTKKFNSGYLEKRVAVSQLIKTVADGIDVRYNYGIGKSKGTYGRPVKVVDYLESIGYKVEHKKNRNNINVQIQEDINESLYKGYPVFVGALGSFDGRWSGHAWLIDGCKYTENNDDWICHINMGWGGRGNGWYMRNCFDSTKAVNIEANNYNEEISITLLALEDEFRYTWMFNIIIIE